MVMNQNTLKIYYKHISKRLIFLFHFLKDHFYFLIKYLLLKYLELADLKLDPD
jgi:hypothetical protein